MFLSSTIYKDSMVFIVESEVNVLDEVERLCHLPITPHVIGFTSETSSLLSST